jgi:hypothetical protein
VTLLCLVVLAVLVLNELQQLLLVSLNTELSVDTERDTEFHIEFDLQFPAIPCACTLHSRCVTLSPLSRSAERRSS